MQVPAAVLLAACLAAPLRAQDGDPAPRATGARAVRWGDEGPLRNGTFLPQSEPAAQALARGDASWTTALRGGPGAETARSAAFDAWAEALAASAPGDAVRVADGASDTAPWDDPDGTAERRLEGVEVAVLRRLAQGGRDARAQWRERFDGLARAALDAAGGDPRALAEVERRHPRTHAAALAALRCADLALEEGRPLASQAWLERARSHAAELPDDQRAGLDAACARRAEVARALAPPSLDDDAWRTADALELVRSTRLESRRTFGRPTQDVPLGRALTPGAVFLPDGDLVVQGPLTLTWLDAEALHGPTGGRTSRLVWSDLLPEEKDPRPFAAPSAGGWPLVPAHHGRAVFAVVDRGQAGRMVRDIPVPARGNHLVCLRIPEDGRATVAWSLQQDALVRDGSAERVPLSEALGIAGRFEFQPGPTVHEGTLFVQARRLPQPGEGGVFEGGDLWLFALRALDGELLWSRHLTDAADLRRDGGRGTGRNEVPTSGMPLAVLDGTLLVGTNVGLVCAFDAVDGRLAWALRNQRREAEEAGWPGSRPPLPLAGTGALVTPFDSEFAYAVPLRAVFAGDFLPARPLARGELLDVVAWSVPDPPPGAAPTLLGREGRFQALFTRGARGERIVALHLDEGERFAGAGLTSPTRALVASDRALYLLDRADELRLLDACALPDLSGGRGGDVRAHGDSVVVVGGDTLWILRATAER